ncbi:MAG: hypothetical protein HYT21_02885 [Candidatus Nealsonbacteria bacterium]|nr:hypothetical protein [Candidatus Nealsonbacteria bacterium]
MTKILGFIDILAGLLFVSGAYGMAAPGGMALAIGAVMILKGVLFITNFFSWIDIAVGVILVFGLAASLPHFLLLGLAAFVGIKGLASLLTFS